MLIEIDFIRYNLPIKSLGLRVNRKRDAKIVDYNDNKLEKYMQYVSK